MGTSPGAELGPFSCYFPPFVPMEFAQIAAQSAAQANFDAKKYICGPWIKSARGGPFNEFRGVKPGE